MLSNEPIGHVDLFGLNPIAGMAEGADFEYSSVEIVLAHLDRLANLYKKHKEESYQEIGKAIEAVASDLRLTSSVSGNDAMWFGPERVAIWALQIQATPKLAARCDDRDMQGSACNLFVTEALRRSEVRVPYKWGTETPFSQNLVGTGVWHNPKELSEYSKNYKEVYRVNVVNYDNDFPQLNEFIKVVKKERRNYDDPRQMGDVISYPKHVGIYIGHGLYVSASAGELDGQSNRIAIKKVNDKHDQIYYTPRDIWVCPAKRVTNKNNKKKSWWLR
jgi:hypothetical protein